eukprot:m.119665 g.119665  ORF g.119665 m.119665 type:complete len:327 (-) comp28752_c0_seq2:111-1091(-)
MEAIIGNNLRTIEDSSGESYGRSRKRSRTSATSNYSSSGSSKSSQISSKQQFYIDEIMRLTQESEKLEAELETGAEGVVGDTTSDDITTVLKVLLQVSDAAIETEGTLEDIDDDDDTETVSAQLHTLANVTGITFTEVKHTLLPRSTASGPFLRRYGLQGTAFDLDFELEFDVRETEHIVDRLKVNVPNEARIELAPFLNNVEKTLSPHLFFQVFVKYAELSHERGNAFNTVLDHYPDMVVLPQGTRCGSFMTVDCSNGSPRFNITWSLDVSESGKVNSSLQLAASGSGMSTEVAQKTSARFGGLVRHAGAAKALELLLEAIASHS